MAEVTLKIPNISCHHCIMTITRELKQLPAVRKVEGNVEAKEIRVEFEGEALDTIKQTLAEIGYPAEG